MRNHFKHSVELVDGEGDIVDVLAAVEDFLLAQATYQAARQRWPKERIRLSQQTRIVEDSSRDPHLSSAAPLPSRAWAWPSP